MDKQQKDTALRHLMWFVFTIIIAYFKFAYHELWKDEWQAWFVAKDKSIGAIFSFLYYEGHPALWYLYLKVFTLFSSWSNPFFIISLAHLLTISAVLYFLFIRLKLPIMLTVMFALSYFIFFEYGIVNRGYSLVMLFAFMAASLISNPNHKDWHLGLALFLLCQTEVYGVMIAIAIGLYIYLDCQKSFNRLLRADFYGLGLGFLFFLMSVFPRAVGHVAKTQGKTMSMSDKLLTSIQGNLSNTYLIGSTPDTFAYGWSVIGLILSAFCLAGIIFMFRHNRSLLVTYLVFILMMVSFSVLFFMGGVRQWGMGFIFFVVMIHLRGISLTRARVEAAFIFLFCIFGIIHNYKALQADIRLPFTNAKDAGIFLRDKVPPKVPIVAINKFEATPVIGYAGRNFYELPDGVEFSYFRWVDRIYIPTERELKLFGTFKGVGGIVIISPRLLDAERYPAAQLWQKFDANNYKNENYYLYTLAVK
jgi:hypothetical protein